MMQIAHAMLISDTKVSAPFSDGLKGISTSPIINFNINGTMMRPASQTTSGAYQGLMKNGKIITEAKHASEL